MSHRKITMRFLDSLSKGTGKDVFYRDPDLPGFGVKVTAGGKVTFIAEGKIKGTRQSKRKSLGVYPVMSLDQGKDAAKEFLFILGQGEDPVAKAAAEKAEKAKEEAKQKNLSVTLQSVFDDFLKARELKPKTVNDYENTVKNCFADWLGSPVRDITRKDVEQRFYDMKANRGKAQATKAIRYLSSIMNYAKADEIDGERLITENPCEVLKDKKVDRKVKPRERYLEKDELKAVVEELQYVHHPEYQKQKNRLTNPTVADYLTLLLFTGLRRDEAAGLEWDRVNLDKEYFSIEDTKNGEKHVVPMSGQVRSMLQRRYEEAKKHDRWVFPAKRGDGHLVEPRKQIEKLAEITGVKFTSHDLRRTFATLADSYGLDYNTIKRALNHKNQDITERYIQTRADKMRHAFNAIAEEICWWAFDQPHESLSSEEKAYMVTEQELVELE